MGKREAMERVVLRGDVGAALEAFDGAVGFAARRHALDRLERTLRHADPGSVPVAMLDRLQSAGVGSDALAFANAEVPPHAVHVAFVEGGGEGFCRLMHLAHDLTGREPDLLESDARLAVEDAVSLAASHGGRLHEGGYRLLPYAPRAFEGAKVEGRSLAAAAFVSAASRFSGRPVKRGTVVSGALAAGALTSVGELPAKVRAAARRSDLRRLVVPVGDAPVARACAEGNGLEIVGVENLDELARACLEEAAPYRDFAAEVAAARRSYGEAWQGYKWPVLLEPFARLASDVPERRPDLRIRALAMYGAVLRAVGAIERSADVLEHGLALLRSPEAEVAVPDAERSLLWRHVAMTERALCDFDAAAEAAKEAVASARRGRLRKDLVSALGTQGLVAGARGDLRQAIELQEEAKEHAHAHDPRMVPRAASYLVQSLGRAGRIDEARAEYGAALSLLRSLGASSRSATDETWLRASLAGALVDVAPAEACDLLRSPLVDVAVRTQPLPGLVLRRTLGLARVATGHAASGWALLAASPIAHGQLWETQLRFHSRLNVLHEARSRLAHGHLDADARARARQALAELPPTLAAQDHLARELSALSEALRDGSETALAAALEALFVAAEALV